MAALSEQISMSSNVELLEAMTARRAAFFTMELGFGQSTFEGDSEIVVKALTGEDSTRSAIGHIVKNTRGPFGWRSGKVGG